MLGTFRDMPVVRERNVIEIFLRYMYIYCNKIVLDNTIGVIDFSVNLKISTHHKSVRTDTWLEPKHISYLVLRKTFKIVIFRKVVS